MKRLLVVLALLASALAVAPAARGTGNLAPNPGFEDGTSTAAPGWTTEGVADFRVRADKSHTGTRSVSVRWAATPGGWWRPATPIAVDPARRYSMAAWITVAGTAPSTGAQMAVRWLDASGNTVRDDFGPVHIPDEPNWILLAWTDVQPPATAATALPRFGIRPSGSWTGGEAAFDDVSFADDTPVPTPAPTPSATPMPPPVTEPQPPVSAHPQDAAAARTAFASADTPWQYHPMFYADFDSADPEVQRAFLREMHSRGIRNAILRPITMGGGESEYLSDAHFNRTARIVQQARDEGMRITLSDEYDFPSGGALGQVVAHDANCRAWKISESAPGEYREERGAQVTGLGSSASEYPDLLNASCTQYLLDITHRAYSARLGAAMANTVVAMYTDEPALYTDGQATSASGSVPWTGDFEAQFLARHGYEIRPRLRALFRDDGPDTAKVRIDYWHTVADLLTERYASPVAAWAADSNVSIVGHLFNDDSPDQQQRFAGDYMRWLRSMQMPGQDIVSREDEEPWHMRQTPSAASEAGRGWAYTEGHNNMGPGSRPQDMKAIVDKALARGSNVYSLYYCCQRSQPYIQIRWQPWTDRLPAWSDYYARIAQAISGGRPGAQIAVLSPWSAITARQSMGSGSFATSNQVADAVRAVSTTLDGHQMQWQYMTEEYLAGAVEGATLRGGAGEEYEALVLPRASHIPVGVMRAIRDFWAAGGLVVALGEVPSHAAEGPGAPSDEVAAISAQVFGTANGVLVPSAMPDDVASVIASRVRSLAEPLDDVDRTHLLAYTRRYDGLDLHLLVNQLPPPPVTGESRGPGYGASEGTPVETEWAFEGEGVPELWDAETGTQTLIPTYRTEGGRTIVRLRLGNTGSALVALRPNGGGAGAHVTEAGGLQVEDISLERGRPVVRALAQHGGTHTLQVRHAGRDFAAAVDVADVPPPIELDTGWTVCFRPGHFDATTGVTLQSDRCQTRGAGSWTLPDPTGPAPPVVDEQVATYARRVDGVPVEPGLRWTLDLGEVAETARVTLNGAQLPDRNWTPYALDVTSAIAADNVLEVLVQATNLPTQEAGIIGPIRLVATRDVTVTM